MTIFLYPVGRLGVRGKLYESRAR